MSSQSQGGSTAETAIAQFLHNNPGWHEVRAITVATGYSNGHIRNTAKRMADDNNDSVEGRKNLSKPVVGYSLNGTLEVPGANRQKYIRLIKQHATHPPSNLSSMSLSKLQDELRRVADSTTRIESKLEFRIP
jgi:hypothetical protein